MLEGIPRTTSYRYLPDEYKIKSKQNRRALFLIKFGPALEPKLHPSTKEVINMAANAAVEMVKQIEKGNITIPVAHEIMEGAPALEDYELKHTIKTYS